jgi:hypothetical protein
MKDKTECLALEKIRETFSVLGRPGKPVEVRVLDYPYAKVTTAGYFDDHDKAAAAALKYSGCGQGVYLTLNEIHPGLIARIRNRMQERAKQTTSDGDVIRRRWLPLDFDPKRPAGIPSTDVEHEAAQETARQCRDYLAGMDWPEPVEGDSGNGAALLYALDLPNNAETTKLIERCIQALGWRFSDTVIGLDLTVFNAARIWRVYGTDNTKGDGAEDRPHRPSGIVKKPEAAEVVSVELLEKLAALAPKVDFKRAGGKHFTGNGIDPGRWLPEHGVGVKREGPWLDGGYRWVLEECPWNDAHQDYSAYVVRLGSGAIAAGCHHDGCAGKGWHELRDRFEPGWRERHRHNGYAGHAGHGTGQKSQDDSGPQETKPEAPWEEVLPVYSVYPATPFPVNVFPEDHQRYIREGAAAMNCPPDFFGVPMLVVAGGAIGNSFRLAVTNNHHQSSALYSAVVGRAGSVKSPALEEVARPLEQAERRHYLRFREQMKAWRESPEEERDAKPTLKRVLVDDTTTEALGSALEANPRGLTMVRDELAALVCGLNQYKAGKGHDRQIYLKIWNHATIRIDRKNNPDGIPLRIYRPFLAILGGIQPSILDMLHGSRGIQRADDGYLDRYLFAYPEDKPATGETWREISEQASGVWASTIDRLLDKEMTQEGDGTKRPWLKRLTKTGKDEWVAFTTAHAAELNDEKFPENLRGAWSKLRGYCARLALILHCLRLAVGERIDPDVDGESILRAVKLVDYFKDHARRVHGLMATDRGTEAARRILQWIARHERKELKRWEVWKDLESQEWFQRIEDLDEPLARLIRHRYLRLRTPSKNPSGGRPADPVYEVNPLWDRRVNRVNPANPSGEESLHGLLGLHGEHDEAEIPEDWMDDREPGQEG